MFIKQPWVIIFHSPSKYFHNASIFYWTERVGIILCQKVAPSESSVISFVIHFMVRVYLVCSVSSVAQCNLLGVFMLLWEDPQLDILYMHGYVRTGVTLKHAYFSLLHFVLEWNKYANTFSLQLTDLYILMWCAKITDNLIRRWNLFCEGVVSERGLCPNVPQRIAIFIPQSKVSFPPLNVKDYSDSN